MIERTEGSKFDPKEVRLALRNHGMHLEGLHYPTTPLGMHYLLIHFDVPMINEFSYELEIAGHVRNPLKLSLKDIKARPQVNRSVVMECAGNGRSKLSQRPVSVPWDEEAVGCSEWTGTPLAPFLKEAGLSDHAAEILFTGSDRGIGEGMEHNFERSLKVEEALSEDVLLVYAMNHTSLLPQHGYPLRLIVPDHYGVASVKWLRSITALRQPFKGVQQTIKYVYQESKNDPGKPVTRQLPRALMVPPGIPEYLTRKRHVGNGCIMIEGKAWSGYGSIERVEFSADGGKNWQETRLGDPIGPHAWTPWSYEWEARESGEYELCVRATDGSGRTQPMNADDSWNVGGYCVNAVQRVLTTVRH